MEAGHEVFSRIVWDSCYRLAGLLDRSLWGNSSSLSALFFFTLRDKWAMLKRASGNFGCFLQMTPQVILYGVWSVAG
ncbi:hypothetical protein VU11_02400 [Desulfobulbus sp. US2]|uniref:Uncharacterized protein n=1 Tax=Candidatus Electrothrix communis TaxID=1859133 RepID=A0A444J9E9_9BACT|nr:hypothetical protein [Desulfobulbus sp. US4]MCW5207519.1 hypothetical protein [Desulfobulbus sp. US2]RWX49690.1 hypothetical protein VT98_10185 [Candidatus Electrothrix communis]WLE97608.1 MAG: hypothetical protein QTN59_01970 [Candidatus Electrothrix communis]